MVSHKRRYVRHLNRLTKTGKILDICKFTYLVDVVRKPSPSLRLVLERNKAAKAKRWHRDQSRIDSKASSKAQDRSKSQSNGKIATIVLK